jgi:hypothetical protein
MVKRKYVVKVERSNKRATRATDQTKEKTRKVMPLYPIAPLITKERQKFRQTLEKMGLRLLLDLPWDYLSQEMVNEVFRSKPHPDFKATTRG